MQIDMNQSGNQVRISVKGTIDEKGAEELKAQFQKINTATSQEVVIDCREVQHMGSSGIGKILLMYKHLATAGNKLSVINLPEDLYELFLELKLDTLFTLSRKS